MSSKTPSAEVVNIQLTEFTYDPEYDFSSLDEVEVKVRVLTRAPTDKDQFDIMVKITYFDKKASQSVLSTSCVTNYAMTGMAKGVDEEDGIPTVDIPSTVLHLMRIEAVAHARALIATQAASTPFGKTFVSLSFSSINQAIADEVEVTKKKKSIVKKLSSK